MKKLVIMLILATFAAGTLGTTAIAAEKKGKSEVVMTMGKKVHLFHSGEAKANQEVNVGDVIAVYRQIGKAGQQQKKVGEVKVTGFVGDHYFEAEVVKGDVKTGDIAKKENSGFLIQPAK